MNIEKIALNGFRNYDWETAEFSPGTNVVYGPNAQGKTNLLEAVYMLAMGRSFRTRFDRELIGFGFDSAEILAEVMSHERQQTVKISLREGQRKQIAVNSCAGRLPSCPRR
jgi:DNA replication and repair protein RecF